VGQVEVQQPGEIAERWCDAPSEAFTWQKDIRDQAIAATGDSLPFAAVCAFHPRHAEAAISVMQEPLDEVNEGAPFLLRARAGVRGKGEQEEGKDKERHG
jgi:hypothetical protein